MTISPCFLLRMKNISNNFSRENKTHTLCSVTFSENRAVYEITSKNMAELERVQITWRLRMAYSISKLKRAKAQARVSTGTPTHTRERAHIYARTHTHAVTNTRARAHTGICKYLVIFIAFYGNNSFVKALPCSVTRTLPLLFNIYENGYNIDKGTE